MPTKKKYELTCHFEGNQNTFAVLIPCIANVDKLRNLICQKQEKTGIFCNVDPTNLTLFKVCQGFSVIIHNCLAEPTCLAG